MSGRDAYVPGPADVARVVKDGASWTLVLVREYPHPPELVWEALTDPAQLREWAPFDASANLGSPGTAVRLTTAGAPMLHVTETTVQRAEAPRLLVYNWGGNDLRWELVATAGGTRLTLWTSIDRAYIAMGAAGWHVCLDVLDRWLGGAPMGRLVGMDALTSPGWQRLREAYARRFAEVPD